MQCRACDAELTAAARFCAACGAAAPAVSDPQDALRTALEQALGFQYRVERLLGRGGMGAVYLATELALEREVAIKVLPPERGADEEGRARFRREARTAARLNHPNVVPLLTFGEVNGLAYYVMGYVRGESLGARLRQQERPGFEEAARILAEMADALDYAHRQGIVHRDIKPDNILIEEESGRALLTDFGVARGVGGQNLTSTGAVVGTPRYMSPEQAAGSGTLDGRSDLYSLGLVGYELVAGTTPFDGRTPADQILQRVSRAPAPLHVHCPDAPAWLATAIGRCLERDPVSRWPDGRALRDHLLSGGAAGEIPLALKNVGQGAQLLAAAAAYAGWLWLWARTTGSEQRWLMVHGRFDPEPTILALSLFVPLLGLLALNARRKGHGWRSIGAAMVRQPWWWVGPYPRRARRPGDVWDRLPQPLRVARTLLMAAPFVAWYVLLVSAIDLTGLEQYQRFGSARRLHPPYFLAISSLFVYLPAVVAAYAFASRRLRSGPLAGVEPAEVSPVFVRPTGDTAFWKKPLYAGLLAALPSANRKSSASAPVPAGQSEAVTSTQVRSRTRGTSG